MVTRFGAVVTLVVGFLVVNVSSASAQQADGPYSITGPAWCHFNPYANDATAQSDPTAYDPAFCKSLTDIEAATKTKLAIPGGAVGVPGQEVGYLILQPIGLKTQQFLVEFQLDGGTVLRYVYVALPSQRVPIDLRTVLPSGSVAFSTLIRCEDACAAQLELYPGSRLWWDGRPAYVNAQTTAH